MNIEQIVLKVLNWINQNGILSSIVGFATAFVISLSSGFVSEIFQKRKEKRLRVENFMGKITDLIAIATSEGYKIRINQKDKRRMLRSASHLERLGEKEKALNVRSYMNKWSQVYNMNTEEVLSKDDKEQMISLIKELDKLTDKILS